MSLARQRLVAGALLVAAAVLLAGMVTWLGAPGFDERLVRGAVRLRQDWFGDVMRFLSQVGYSAWLVPTGGVVCVVLGVVARRWRDGLVIAFATPAAALTTRLLKETFERARPEGGFDPLIAGYSMPSGHATSSAAFAAALVIVTHRGRLGLVVGVLAPLFAELVAVSRVVLGVHYPTDVVAGLLLGTGVALVVAGAVQKVPERRIAVASVD